MNLIYDYDPAIHVFVEHPIIKFIRREAKMPILKLYRHAILRTWVVTLFNRERNELLDVAILGDEARPDASKDRVDFAVCRMLNLSTRGENKRRLKEEMRRKRDALNEMAAQQSEVFQKLYARIKRRKGELMADTYASRAGCPELMGGGKPKWPFQA